LEFGKAHKISQLDFFQKLSDKISIHMFTTRASNMSSGSDTLSNREKYNQLVHNLEILDRSKWPKETDPCFGNKQVRELAKELDVCVSSSVHGFREYFISGNCDNFPSDFQPHAAAVNTLVISTTECEWSLSNMNTTISCVRSLVLLKTAAALMFISLVGPSIRGFNPENYVKEWLKKRSLPCRLHFLPSPCRQNIQ
jgi:hypothetical protein